MAQYALSTAGSSSIGNSFDTSLQQKGAVFNGTTDDSAAIQLAISAYSSMNQGKILFPAGLTAKINSPVTCVSGASAIDFNNCTLDASSITSGYALSLLQNPNAPLDQNIPAMPVENLILTGAFSESNVTDGLFMGQLTGSGNVTYQTLRNITVRGFRDGLYIGNQIYIDPMYDIVLQKNWRRGLNFYGVTNAGECISIHGGSISNNHKSDGSAVGIYIEPTDNGGNELYLFGVSIDYNDEQFYLGSGQLNCFGCHMEDNHFANPMGEIVSGSAQFPCGVYFIGGTITNTESSANARPVLIKVGGAGGQAFFVAKCLWQVYDRPSTLVAVTSGTPQIDLEGSRVFFNASTAANYPTIGAATNALYNPAFELGNLNGWESNGTGYTWTADNAAPHSGTYAAKTVSTGAANGGIWQFVSVKPGQVVDISLWLNITALTAGSVFLIAQFYKSNPDTTTLTSVSSTAISNPTTTTSGWTRYVGQYIAPQGCNCMRLQVNGTGFTGTFFVDDTEISVF